MTYRVEPTGASDGPPCECCGTRTRVVWGHVHEGDAMVAAYWVRWTVGAVRQHGASFDLVLGEFGEGAGPELRRAASLAYRIGATGPQFMVVDAASRPIAQTGLASTMLARKDVIGTGLATTVFDLVDAVWVDDERVAEVSGDAG